MALRDANLEKLDGAELDVLVVGGGINGAVSASVLASHGVNVGLVDCRDFAGFTSEQSSNLVWGGIKYMETYEFRLVRHLCQSRNRLMRAYPSNVKEIRFLGTLDEHSPVRPSVVALGALAYWFIGNGATKTPRLLSKKKIKASESVVDISNARGGVEYSDCFMVDNDARFTFKFIRAALSVGAACVNYVRLVSAEHHHGRWECQLRDEETGREFQASAKVLINAGGPFADGLNDNLGITTNHRLLLSKGIHLVVPRIGSNDRVLAFFDDTQRLFFVIPMGHRSVIGTTDTRVSEPVTHVTEEDRQFLLTQINERLDLEKPLVKSDIIAERCGARPLAVESGGDDKADTDWTQLSREHVIETKKHDKQLTIFGGKLTDCLNVGEEVFEEVRKLGIDTGKYSKDWYGEPSLHTRDEFNRQADLIGLNKIRPSAYEPLSKRLWRRYGYRAFSMLEAIRDDPTMAEEVMPHAEYVRAEVDVAAKTEMVTRFEDFLRRRSKIALLVRHDDLAKQDGIMDLARMLFGSDAQMRYDQYFGDVNSPQPDKTPSPAKTEVG